MQLKLSVATSGQRSLLCLLLLYGKMVGLMSSVPSLFSMGGVPSSMWIHCLKHLDQQWTALQTQTHTHPQCIWLMNVWFLGQRLIIGGQPDSFPLSHKTSTSEDTAAEHCRPQLPLLSTLHRHKHQFIPYCSHLSKRLIINIDNKRVWSRPDTQ